MRLRTRYKKLTLWNKLFVWGAIVAIVGFVYTVVSNFYTSSKLDSIDYKIGNIQISEDNEKEKSTKTKTLYELYLSDFSGSHGFSEYKFRNKNKEVLYKAEYTIWADWDSKSSFYSVFFPKSDYTFKACKFLIPKYRKILKDPALRILLKAFKNAPPGYKPESWDELTFSGRVYIYHETYLLPDRIKTLTEEYEKEGLSPQFRGRDYLIMKNSPLYDQKTK